MGDVSGFRFKPFSTKQVQVLSWWCDTSPVKDKNGIIADGAIRSGKTVAMSLGFVLWAMTKFNGQSFAMCGKTISSFRRNVLSFLLPRLKLMGYIAEYRRADNVITIRKGKTENHFYVFGGKDESSQDLIQGMTLAGVLFDEVALMPESFVSQATARCSVDGSKFWFNCNPDNPYHWFFVNWIDGDRLQKNNMLYLSFQMDDNLSLSEETKARYKTMYTGAFYARYILGQWTVAEGLIYDMFDVNKHVISPPKDDEYIGSAYISVDYGTLNPTAFLMWRKRHSQWVCMKEYYYSGREKGRQKTDAEYADDLFAFIGNTPYNCVIVDPSAASFISELMKRGIKVIKADNAVLDGIRCTSALINEGQLLFSKVCEKTIREFISYRWDDKAAEHGEDKPIKQNDHAMDAMRYFVSTILGRVVTSHRRRM